MKKYFAMVAGLTLFGLLIGCSREPVTQSGAEQSGAALAANVDGLKFLLTSEPEEAKDVIQVREDASDGADVVIVGRIGFRLKMEKQTKLRTINIEIIPWKASGCRS